MFLSKPAYLTRPKAQILKIQRADKLQETLSRGIAFAYKNTRSEQKGFNHLLLFVFIIRKLGRIVFLSQGPEDPQSVC